jgi:hypothetical protein
MVLLHDQQLWATLDTWLCSLGEVHLMRVLPLLRRAFAAFSAPERRQLGEHARRPLTAAAEASSSDWDVTRAERALVLLRQLLGVNA